MRISRSLYEQRFALLINKWPQAFGINTTISEISRSPSKEHLKVDEFPYKVSSYLLKSDLSGYIMIRPVAQQNAMRKEATL